MKDVVPSSILGRVQRLRRREAAQQLGGGRQSCTDRTAERPLNRAVVTPAVRNGGAAVGGGAGRASVRVGDDHSLYLSTR